MNIIMSQCDHATCIFETNHNMLSKNSILYYNADAHHVNMYTFITQDVLLTLVSINFDCYCTFDY